MKNLTPKSIAIGTALTSASAGLIYAAPLVAQLYPGAGWVTILVGVVPTIVAYLTNARKKVEGSE